jgi:anion-transporting  ArsA/GET3 family ATPase
MTPPRRDPGSASPAAPRTGPAAAHQAPGTPSGGLPLRRAGWRQSPRLDVDALLDNPQTRVVVCCGSGGVGKTTTAAALALRAAERGRRVVVLTIDPARRLAQSMGLLELDNKPRPVIGVDTSDGGRLDAMMLDMKRTFDEVIEAHASPEKARQILENPFYQALSSSFAGTQEYMAMEKLGQLRARADADPEGWDLIVVDTPPSRSALDFLDAPQRLGSFLDGRFIRLLSAPAKAGGRAYMKVFSVAVGTASGVLTKLLGGQILRDVQTFVAALDTVFGGFRERAEQTYRLLQADGTSFLVVAAPEPDALREASYFVERLGAEGMPLAGLVLNRLHVPTAEDLSGERAAAAAEDLEDGGGHALAAGLLRVHADRMRRAEREHGLAARFTSAHPRVPVAEVPARSQDVHDLAGLREIGAALAKG